jgi:Rieske Fe-S protein
MKERTYTRRDISWSESTDRRVFLKKVIGIFTLLGSLILAIPFLGSVIMPGGEKKKKRLIRIASLDLLPVNEPQKINFPELINDAFNVGYENRNVWIIKHSPTSVTVFSPICPHLGCIFNWEPSDQLFVCPCHSSIFSAEGKVVDGPSPRGLDTLPQKIVDGNLYIEWERFEIGVPEKIII